MNVTAGAPKGNDIRGRSGIDRRKNERHIIGSPAIVTIIAEQEKVLYGTLVNIADGGAQLRLDRPITFSALVKIEYANCLLLGEVIYRQQEEGNWLIGVEVEHSLSGLAALEVAMKDFGA